MIKMSFNAEDIKVYQEFHQYDFDGNDEYKKGLDAVFQKYLFMEAEKDPNLKKEVDAGNLDPDKIKPDDKDQLVAQTKVFFFCKQTGNILDLEEYKHWVSTKPPELNMPQYSTSYEQLVDMIVNNKPIPGIKKIPDTVLDPKSSSQHVLKERSKPWEKKD